MSRLPPLRIESHFDRAALSLSYLVMDSGSGTAALIDPAGCASRWTERVRALGGTLGCQLCTCAFEGAETFCVGRLPVRVMRTPGLVPGAVSFVFGEGLPGGDALVVFVGQTLLMPDLGTAGCVAPGSDARTLFRSINRLLALPPDARLFTGRDVPPPGREPRCECTVAEQRERNIHVRDGISEEAFVALHAACNGPAAPAFVANVRSRAWAAAD